MDIKQMQVVQKYTKELIAEGNRAGQLEAFMAEVKDLVTVFQEGSLENFLSQSLVPSEEKDRVLRLIQAQCSPILAGFLGQIMVKSQYELVFDVFQEILYSSQYAMGQFDLVVRSVVPLTDEQRVSMKRLVRRKLNLQVREMTEILDDSLLGGFILEINHKVIDASIRQQLRELKQKIR